MCHSDDFSDNSFDTICMVKQCNYRIVLWPDTLLCEILNCSLCHVMHTSLHLWFWSWVGQPLTPEEPVHNCFVVFAERISLPALQTDQLTGSAWHCQLSLFWQNLAVQAAVASQLTASQLHQLAAVRTEVASCLQSVKRNTLWRINCAVVKSQLRKKKRVHHTTVSFFGHLPHNGPNTLELGFASQLWCGTLYIRYSMNVETSSQRVFGTSVMFLLVPIFSSTKTLPTIRGKISFTFTQCIHCQNSVHFDRSDQYRNLSGRIQTCSIQLHGNHCRLLLCIPVSRAIVFEFQTSRADDER